MPSVFPIPPNLWQLLVVFCASGHPGQIVLHIGNRGQVERATFTKTVAAVDLVVGMPEERAGEHYAFSQ